jgi:oligoendopeptidase F
VDWDAAEYMEYEWARVPHFYMANFRFYNYSYSFAQMLVFALYEAYKEGGEDFAERFKKLLGVGGSKSPHDQLLEFGYDIADPKFWELGAKQADRFLKQLNDLL